MADCPVSAVVSGKIQTVAEIKSGQTLQLLPEKQQPFTLQFGNASGFLAADCHLQTQQVQQVRSVNAAASQMQGYLITTQTTPIYRSADQTSAVLAELVPNLRYPWLAKHDAWYQVRFGDQFGYIAVQQVKADQGIPVLTYHHVLKNEENTHFRHTSTTTSVNAFDQQMALLKKWGYQAISLYEVENYLDGKENFNAKLLAVTFDDGLESVHRYAYPILQKYGLRATIFVITARIKHHLAAWDPNQLQFITRAQYQEMQPTMDLQSHTHFLHRKLKKQPIILRRSLHNMLVDFKRSIQVLRQLNPKVRYLAYPYGSYTALAKKAAQEAGFHLAFSTAIGKVNFGDDRYQLKRIYLLKEDSEQQILEKLQPQFAVVSP
ncbi:polysaccharide deacetylase family protein [Pasteurella testudinis]|uniref:polysaccharide deacetylase family protein n=1 Tax=Pasteurella testudinis TaxID=761 RepID=UPI001356BFA0|nr:polysaccharide deacetylase family protein [Pasteurella testudinis]